MIIIGGIMTGGAIASQSEAEMPPQESSVNRSAIEATPEDQESAGETLTPETAEVAIRRFAHKAGDGGRVLAEAVAGFITIKMAAVALPVAALYDFLTEDGTIYEIVHGVPKHKQDEHREKIGREMDALYAERQASMDRAAERHRERVEGTPMEEFYLEYSRLEK